MLMMADKFAKLAQSISAKFGGPYFDAIVHSKGEAVFDDGGSIITGVLNVAHGAKRKWTQLQTACGPMKGLQKAICVF
ncbi:MAG: hypothetical protein U5N55_11790 [Cypionkella sp.]|nr:hypothetical protein [Cypionkella sp.]